MKKTFAAAPWTKLQVRLIIYRTRAALRRVYRSMGEDEGPGDDIVAFASSPVLKIEGIIAEIHLCREDLSLDTIVHECQHASLHLATYMQLDVNNYAAEDLFATATAHMVCNVSAAVRELRASRRQSKLRRQNCDRASV